VSWRTISIEELDSIIPVKPPVVNKMINPTVQSKDGLIVSITAPDRVLNHLNTFTPVGIAIIIVAEVKYARVSTFRPTVNIW